VAEAKAIVAEMQARDDRNGFLTGWWRDRLDALAAALVSPPGEPVAFVTDNIGVLFAHNAPIRAMLDALPAPPVGQKLLPLYANHEARRDGVRVTDAEALHGAIISRVMPFTRNDMTNEQAASFGEDLMGMIQSALLPPIGDGRAEIVEALEAARDLAKTMEGLTAGRSDDDYVWAAQAKIEAAIRALSNPGDRA